MEEQNPHLFCFGLGYVGSMLAAHLKNQGWQVSGTVREAHQIPALCKQGIAAHEFDGPLDLSGVTHVLSTIPPINQSDLVSCRITNYPALRWLGYLSTTGVYGDTAGIVVHEDAVLNPSSQRAVARVVAEKQWQELNEKTGIPAHIFRLPGIYGPGRNVFEQYKANRLRRINKPGHLFNRIHVDDIIKALQASMDRPRANIESVTVYNIVDDLACEPSDVATYGCELMGITPPPMVDFDDAATHMSAMALSFWQDNRRVSNHKMKAELGVTLRYPDYRQGLEAIWQTMAG